MRRWNLLIALFIPLFAQAQTFTDVTLSAGIQHKGFDPVQMTGGVVWFDYDGDGDEDLYTTGSLLDNTLFRNNGDGTFTDVTAAAGLTLPPFQHTQGVMTGDIDNDGFRELFITTWLLQPNFLFKNNGDGTFTDISLSSGLGVDTVWTTAASFEDFNGDGLLDLYCANYVREGIVIYDSNFVMVGYAHHCDPNQLWINNGDLTFTDVTSNFALADTGCGLALTLSDFDGDNDRDILIANDFGDWVYPNVMYRNEWPAPFADISVAAGMDGRMYAMGIAVGDYDHDLDPDYYYTDIGGNSFYRNNGNGTFSDLAPSNGTINDSLNSLARTSWGTAFLDYDNDTWLDLFVANGYIQLLPSLHNIQQDPDALYRNLGNGNFQDVSMQEAFTDTNASRGMAYADYDRDGDLDLFVNVISIDSSQDERSKLYRNDRSNGNHYAQVSVQGTINNRDGFGAKVFIKAGGITQMQEILSGSSHMSQNSSIAHFGLGTATTVDSIKVVWPDGNVQYSTLDAADTRIHIVEDSSLFAGRDKPMRRPLPLRAGPNPFSSTLHAQVDLLRKGDLRWELIDLQGRILLTLTQADAGIGTHAFTWDGSTQDGTQAAAGLYFLRANTMHGSAVLRIQKID